MAIVKSAVVVFALAAVAGGAAAQQPAFKRTVLQQADISIPGREAVTAIAELPSGVSVGRHTHPGEECGYILEGPLTIDIDGKSPMVLQTGQTFIIPAGTVHNAIAGATAGKILSTYIVEKGKPLATPAAAK